MRTVCLCLAICGFVGCDEFQKLPEGPASPARQKETTPAVAATNDTAPAQTATSGSGATNIPTATPATIPQPTPQPADPAATATTTPAAQPAAQPTGSIIGKLNGRVVDLAEAKKNPKVVEVSGKVVGDDPLTATFNAYVSITSRASVLSFKHQMDILKEVNGGTQYPSFKEAQQLMKQLKIEVASLPPYQMYGYDTKTGGLVLLEDKGEKIRLYKANNIPLDDADKPFDM